ncbi:MAG TPA: hypothetical protein PLD41_08980 [Casimicrobium huifangae]|nr:hypothetical protein [Casimicrobium huifangae]
MILHVLQVRIATQVLKRSSHLPATFDAERKHVAISFDPYSFDRRIAVDERTNCPLWVKSLFSRTIPACNPTGCAGDATAIRQIPFLSRDATRRSRRHHIGLSIYLTAGHTRKARRRPGGVAAFAVNPVRNASASLGPKRDHPWRSLRQVTLKVTFGVATYAQAQVFVGRRQPTVAAFIMRASGERRRLLVKRSRLVRRDLHCVLYVGWCRFRTEFDGIALRCTQIRDRQYGAWLPLDLHRQPGVVRHRQYLATEKCSRQTELPAWNVLRAKRIHALNVGTFAMPMDT